MENIYHRWVIEFARVT